MSKRGALKIFVKTRAFVAFFSIVTATIVLASSLYRPFTLPGIIHTPDEKHLHQVYNGNPITQEISQIALALDQIAFWVDEQRQPPSETVLTLTITELETDRELQKVSAQYGTIKQNQLLEYYDQKRSLSENVTLLVFPLEMTKLRKTNSYAITLSTGNLPRAQALRVRYESDQDKYPTGKSRSADGPEQGNLGFILYERPALATLIWRWLINPRHILIWPAITAMAIGALSWIKLRDNQENAPETLPVKTIYKNRYWLAIFPILAIVIYWPATSLWYYHDDIPLLARIKHFEEQGQPWKILSAHDYLETAIDEEADFGFFFWRPVSAGLYTWTTYHLFEETPQFAYFTNILHIGLTASGLFLIALAVLRSPPAAILTAILWLVHSSKIGVAYWWSASQNILASLFSVIAIVLYLFWRSNHRNKKLLAFSLLSFATAALSKEHAFLVPAILIVLELLATKRDNIKRISGRIAPFILIAGLLLAVRTIALGDPTLPHTRRVDTTYEFSLTPQNILHNITTYLSWSAENWLWPTEPQALQSLEQPLRNWLWRQRIQAPIYPGAILLVTVALALTLLRAKRTALKIIFFGLAWWFIFLIPQLTLLNDWRSRWLYLPIFGFALVVGLPIKQISKRYQSSVALLLGCTLIVFGLWHTRNGEQTQFFTSQSNYISQAVQQYNTQKNNAEQKSNIFFVGVAEHQTTSLTAYLIRLLHPYYPFKIIRTNKLPISPSQQDIIIDMSDIDAYYPEHER